jgi:hypothetical protein
MEMSPSRERVALIRGEPVATTELVEVDDSITALPRESSGGFVGEDFFFQNGDAAHTLWRAPPAAPPEVVATDVLSYAPIYPPGGPLLVTFPASGDPVTGDGPLRFLDPVTYQERLPSIAANRLASLSPDARWALLSSSDPVNRGKVALLEVATGAEEPFELPPSFGETKWRPGHDEVWIQQPRDGQQAGPTLIKRPGASLGATPVAAADDSVGLISWFTRDGRHWFSRGPQMGRNVQTFVGDADDPAAPRYPLNAEGTEIWLYAQRSDGRLLIEVTYASAYRMDIFIIDPTNGAARLLGTGGRLLTWGERRAVANLRYNNESGDLTVIDIDSGESTVLAAEFAQDAVVEPSADGRPVEPGARVVFHFRARFESPFDGIWVTTLP